MEVERSVTAYGMRHGEVTVVAAFLIGMFVFGCHVGLTRAEARVDDAWAQVALALERRADLGVELLVAVSAVSVEGRELGPTIASARLRLRTVSDPEDAARIERRLDRALSRLIVIAERHPELRSTERTDSLLEELASNAEGLMAASSRHADAVRTFNAALASAPMRLVAGPLGFVPRAAGGDGQGPWAEAARDRYAY